MNWTKETAECASQEPTVSQVLWKKDKTLLIQSAGTQRLDGDLELELRKADISWDLMSQRRELYTPETPSPWILRQALNLNNCYQLVHTPSESTSRSQVK